jgi:hypothetical protein
MAIRPVLKMGDPRLWHQARAVETFDTPDLHALVADMQETMRHLNGAGLAAPQIGVDLRVVIFGMERNPRYPDAESVPFTILINPVLTPLSDEMEDGGKVVCRCRDSEGWCRAGEDCATPVSTHMARRLRVRWKVSTRASCNTSATTWTEFSTRAESATSAALALPRNSFPTQLSHRTIDEHFQHFRRSISSVSSLIRSVLSPRSPPLIRKVSSTRSPSVTIFAVCRFAPCAASVMATV